MKNPTNGDSVMLKVMNFIEANQKIQAIEANKAVLDMAVRDKLKKKEIPYISLKVMEPKENSMETIDK